MMKNNILTLIFLCAAMAGAVTFSVFAGTGEHGGEMIDEETIAPETDNIPEMSFEQSEPVYTEDIAETEDTAEEENGGTESPVEHETESGNDGEDTERIESYETETVETEEISYPPYENVSVDNALFIGDSRTVGIMEYAGITGADYFCETGMTVFNAMEDRLSVMNVGKLTLDELLKHRKYDRIYIMLGINELGCDIDSVVRKYGEILDNVREMEQYADIFVMANLHVSEKRSKKDTVINNTSINRLNGKISSFAEYDGVYYLDVNPLFDDANGNLSADKTFDDVHLYAKYYSVWGAWIGRETMKYNKEG